VFGQHDVRERKVRLRPELLRKNMWPGRLQRLLRRLSGEFDLQWRWHSLRLQRRVQGMRQPVRCDLGLLHQWHAGGLPGRTNVL
jgi:hypothetical protein